MRCQGWLAALALFPFAVACGGKSSRERLPRIDHDACVVDCGPHYDDFFDESKVATLRIDFGPEVSADDVCFTLLDPATGDRVDHCHPHDPRWLNYLWSKWGHCPGGEFVPARVTYESEDGRGNVTMEDVGVRFRGGVIRGATALQGMKLDFDVAPGEGDRISGKRRFAGLNRVNLLSVEGQGIKNKEASLMMQCLAYRTLREAGGVAPRCNHLNVIVNGEYYGLMQNVEPVSDRRFMRNAFDDRDGTLYEASSGCPPYRDSMAKLQYEAEAGDEFVYPYSPVAVPDDVPGLHAAYEVLETGPRSPEPTGEGGAPNAPDPVPPEKPADMSLDEWSVVSHPERSAHAEAELIPMLKCGDETTTPDRDDFAACIREWIDVDEWLTTVAAESITPTLESLMVMRNYYLLFRADPAAPHGGRFILYSWDLDTAFHRQACYPSDCNPFESVAGWYVPNPRASLLLRLQRVFEAEYCGHLRRILAEAYRPELVDEMAAVLRPHIPLVQAGFLGPEGEPVVTPDEWEREIATIRDFIGNRRAIVQGQIDAECP